MDGDRSAGSDGPDGKMGRFRRSEGSDQFRETFTNSFKKVTYL